MPISAPHHFQKVARQGIEPCLTVSKTVVRIHHTRKPCCFHQCPCQESNLIFDLRRVACASTTLHRHFLPSGAGGIRTHKHLLLKQAAQLLAYHTILRETLLRFELNPTCFADMSRTKRSSAIYQVVLDGLEPSIDWCKPGAFAAGPQDYVLQTKRKTRDSNPEALFAPTTFKVVSSSSRMSSIGLSALDEDRTRRDLIDSQAPPPDGFKGFIVKG